MQILNKIYVCENCFTECVFINEIIDEILPLRATNEGFERFFQNIYSRYECVVIMIIIL